MTRRRLHVLGQPLDVEATIATSDPPATALFAAARGVSETISLAVQGRERARGRSPTCREGCAACCRHLIPISTVEAVHLARAVASMPEARRRAVEKRFADAVRRLKKANLLDDQRPAALRSPPLHDGESPWDATSRRYRELAIACPFLEDARCSVYADRPLVCREYAVTSPPERCAHPRSEGVVAVPRPVRMSEVLAETVRALAPDTETTSVPLALTLVWSEAHGAEVDAALTGNSEELARTLLDLIDVEDEALAP